MRQDERVTAGPFGNEACPKDLEAGLLEPGDVGRTIGMAPVHRRSEPVVFGTGPGTGSHRRELKLRCWNEPASARDLDRGGSPGKPGAGRRCGREPSHVILRSWAASDRPGVLRQALTPSQPGRPNS